MGSNPTSSASATSAFTESDDGWSAWGPLPVGQRCRTGLLQAVGKGLHFGGEQVPVGVQGDAGRSTSSSSKGIGRAPSHEVVLLSAVAAFAVPAALWIADALPAVESESASPGLGHRGLLAHRPYRLNEATLYRRPGRRGARASSHLDQRCDGAGREACQRSARRVRAGEARWEEFLYELKAGPAGRQRIGGHRAPTPPSAKGGARAVHPFDALGQRTSLLESSYQLCI